MKKYFIFLFVFSNILSFAQYSFTDIPGTDGTSINPYQIWTKEHLKEFGDSLASKHPPFNMSWCYDKHFRLMESIIEPITESVGPLVGHFHGNGKKITLATIFDYTTNPSVAIFSGLSHGSIDSLIADGYANGVGGMAAISNYISHSISSITNCINNATVTGGAGITYTNSGTISNCINNGDITGVDRIGGIAGENSGTIINCINTGKITATASGDNNIFSGVGGIVGTAANGCVGILNCVNLGSVVGQGFVGGIVGLVRGMNRQTPITNCINYGYVRGINGVGGILGYMFNQYVNVSNCVNVGVVEGEEDTGSIVGKE